MIITIYIFEGWFVLGLFLYVPGVLVFTPTSMVYVVVTSIYNFIWPDWIQDEGTERTFFKFKVKSYMNFFECPWKRFQERLQTFIW